MAEAEGQRRQLATLTTRVRNRSFKLRTFVTAVLWSGGYVKHLVPRSSGRQDLTVLTSTWDIKVLLTLLLHHHTLTMKLKTRKCILNLLKPLEL